MSDLAKVLLLFWSSVIAADPLSLRGEELPSRPSPVHDHALRVVPDALASDRSIIPVDDWPASDCVLEDPDDLAVVPLSTESLVLPVFTQARRMVSAHRGLV